MYDKKGHRKAPGNFKMHGLYGRVLKDGKSLLTNEPFSHPDSIGVPEDHPPLHAFLGVPLMNNGKTMGIIAVANREGGYREEDRHALEALAPVIVVSFGRKRAEEGLRESEASFRSLFETMNEGFALHEIVTDEQGRPVDYRFLNVNPALLKSRVEALR